MPRSLFSAVTGLRTNQERMDVIADNIANVNTTAFKSSRESFVNSFSQTLRPPTNTQPAGVQIGLGNQVSHVSTNFNQGAFQRTDVTTDLAISGEGFFMVNSQPAGAGTNFFTRDGSFAVDRNGFLITALGHRVRGVVGTPAAPTNAVDPLAAAPGAIGDIIIPSTFGVGPETTVRYSIDTDGRVSLFGSAGTTWVAGFIVIAKFSTPSALNREGNNLYSFNSAAGDFSGNGTFSETADVRKPGTNGFGTSQSGALELSNVDLSQEFTDMIVTQRGFDSNASVIRTADEMLQTLNSLKR